MRKLILGILAIICLDVGFAAFMSVDQQGSPAVFDPVGLRQIPETRLTKDLAELPPDGPDLDTPSEPTVTEISGWRRSDIPKVARRPSRTSTKAYARTVKKAHRLPLREDFQDITILYAAYKPVEFKNYREFVAQPAPVDRQANGANQQVPELRRSKSKSFGSRAVPILKKPYDLIKAIGSKFY